MNKTRRQKKTERDHAKIIALYPKVLAEGGTQMAIWEEMERRTGFTRQNITRVLRLYNIDYKTRKYEDNQD